MKWTRRRLAPIERECDQLRTTIIQLRRELETKQGAVGRLEVLLHERLTRIDELNGKLEQSRQQVRRLDLQNQILVEMIAAPPLDAAMLSPK
jgi:hypothetical protein